VRWIVLTALLASVPNHVNLDRPANEADLLRAYALGKCLAKAYDQPPFVDDADWSANMYFQMGKLSKGDPYQDVLKLIPTDLKTPTIYENHVIAVHKCIEFYESPGLKAFAKKQR